MEMLFAKPDLTFTFTEHGFLSIYLKSEYDKVNTFSDLVEFEWKWLKDYESTGNKYRKRILSKVVFPLYQLITGRSYETKQFEIYSHKAD